VNTAAPSPALVDLPEAALWTSRAWVDFAALPAARRARTVVVLPLFGFADWGLGRPLDLEEILGCDVLRRALAPGGGSKVGSGPLVLPPLRFVLGPCPHTLFGVDLETALDLVRELAACVKAAGFAKVVLFNTSPWNEELAEIAACDARVELGLQTFVVNLASLGLDLHPVRSTHRALVQCAACTALGCAPEPDAPRGDAALTDFRPGQIRQPEPLALARPLPAAIAAGRRRLAAAGRTLAVLLDEIAARPPLPKRKPARTIARRRTRR
jgi:creatinine amidohydrolase